jgi:hypothetical protein
MKDFTDIFKQHDAHVREMFVHVNNIYIAHRGYPLVFLGRLAEKNGKDYYEAVIDACVAELTGEDD